VAHKRTDTLRLGNLKVARDWGWAPEYVEAMWRMLSADRPDDYVIATGRSHTLGEFAAEAFSYFDLDWRNHVKVDEELFRPSDIALSAGDPGKAFEVLGWRAEADMPTIIKRLIEAELEESVGS
jgi:GDPmannose 4,6-dehydratase